MTSTTTAPPPTTRHDGFRLAELDDPVARNEENRGRAWLVVAYLLCPCHLPVSASLLAAAVGGTSIGAWLASDAIALGLLLGALWLAALAVAFGHLRRARVGSCIDGSCAIDEPAGL